jgi:DNA-binding transcriptional ArsR family regulator
MNPYRTKANLLRLMAHPIRLQILEALLLDSECVCHLAALMHKPQPYVSQQLAVLRNAGVIVDEKEGTNVFYGLADGAAADQVAAILRAVAGEKLTLEVKGHQHVVGCYCPKCQPDGTCRPPGDPGLAPVRGVLAG